MSEYERGYLTAMEDLEQYGRSRCGVWDFAFIYGLLTYLRRKLEARRIGKGG